MAKELFKKLYLFKNFAASDLDALTRLSVNEKREGGEFFFTQGDSSKALYVVKYGSVRIRRSTPTGETVDVALLGTGSHFGEMGFIDGEPRTASAEATEPTEVLKIEYSKLGKFFDENPKVAAVFYKSVALFLCGRLSQTTHDLGFAREKALKKAA